MRSIPDNYDPRTGLFRRGYKKGIPKAEVMAMYADYQSGMSLAAVGRKHRGVTGSCVREIFAKRGLAMRKSIVSRRPHDPSRGCFLPDPAKTPEQITAMIAGLNSLRVPAGLKTDWIKWPMARRAAFIARLRKKFPSTMPAGKYSANVEPFKYGWPNAMALLEKTNAGKPSRVWTLRIFPNSEGVIYRGKLYFWVESTGYCTGRYPRQALHHDIWTEANGRPVPPQMRVIHLDGNKNNFDPRNLGLRSMADCARMNAWHRRTEQFPGLAQRIGMKAWETKNQKRLRHSRATISTLLSGKPNLLNQLQRRKHETAVRP